MEAKIKELENDSQFIKKIANLTDIEDVAAAFSNEGVEIEKEEIDKFKNCLDERGELNEELLAEVSGGCKYWPYWLGVYLSSLGKCRR